MIRKARHRELMILAVSLRRNDSYYSVERKIITWTSRRDMTMIKYIRTAGTFCLIIGVLLAAAAAILAAVGNALDNESKLFVDATVPAIISEWDVMELKKRASPE